MGKGWVWDWLVVRLSAIVMHLMCGYGGGLGGGGIIGSFGSLVCMIANGFSNAKVFSLVNQLRIIKKVNLLKFKLSRGHWGYDIKTN